LEAPVTTATLPVSVVMTLCPGLTAPRWRLDALSSIDEHASRCVDN
jgi:hypothetical protein